MEVDPLLTGVVLMALAIFIIGLLLRIFDQPYVIGYVLAGAALAQLGFIPGDQLLEQFGNLGIMLLLFFIGMHVSLPKLVDNWRVAIVGTLLQIVLTVGAVWLLGAFLDWPLGRIILFGFVVSLSSTAVILKILEQWKELDTRVGQNVLGVLLVQDLAIIPMIVILGLFRGEPAGVGEIAIQLAGGLVLLAIVAWVFFQDTFRIPFLSTLRQDHEMQVFLALIACFGFALLAGMAGLSTALGAFVAGLIVSRVHGTGWIQSSLESIRVILVALFFIYIGTLISMEFLAAHAVLLTLLVFGVLLLNTALNTAILLALGDTWKESLYAGGLLAQIGEFSFLLAAVGFANGIILDFGYQLTITTIALTLLISPFWIQIVKRIVHIDASYVFEALKR